jgi:signal transduction histidine kinase
VTVRQYGGPAVRIQIESALELGDLLDIGVLTVDASLLVTGWNDWLRRTTGKSATSVLGRPLAEVEPSIRPTALAAIRRAVAGSTVMLSHAFHEYLLEVKTPAGFDRMERMQQNVRILPLSPSGAEPTGATIFIEDVTERVARELELRAAVDVAERANEAKSQFFTAMSHELRTPIGAMSGYADLIAEELFGPVTSAQREHLLRIKTVASHLQHIVNEILSFSRAEAGREELNLSDADAALLAREALVAVEPLATQKGLSVRTKIPNECIMMRTDQVKVRQILINLLGNAIKFTDRGWIEIDISLSDGGDAIAFSVADTGSGIAPADLGKIFDPFTRVVRTHQSKPGTGLGLAVSRSFARLLGGDIAVESEQGVGSRFTATIPRGMRQD